MPLRTILLWKSPSGTAPPMIVPFNTMPPKRIQDNETQSIDAQSNDALPIGARSNETQSNETLSRTTPAWKMAIRRVPSEVLSPRTLPQRPVQSGAGQPEAGLSRAASPIRTTLGAFMLLVLGSAPFPLPVHGALMINEVLYDPEGSDRGAEWVEIHNTGPWPATLDGVVLEAGDGSGPGRWRRTWEGAPGEWIEAGGFCVVGGPWGGRAACSAGILELGNGPDGVRLMREGLELDRVGWGELTAPEYYEGSPALAGASGKSLARVEDGRDTDDNRADFAPAVPTPGRLNHPARDLAVRFLRPGPPTPLSSGDGALRAVVCLENRGSVEVPAGEIRLLVDDQTVLPDPARMPGPLAAGLHVDLEVTLDLSGGAGVRTWSCLVRWNGDLVPENDNDTLRAWAGPSPLRFSEVAPRPAPGGTEWIELECVTGVGSFGGWSVQNRDGTRLMLRDGEALPPGARIVVAHDSAAALADDFVPLAWSGTWPTLHDAATKGEAADTLWLADPMGLVTDWAVYGATAVGETWVRFGGAPVDAGMDAWAVADGPPGGTPGKPNPPSASTNPLSPAGPGDETAAISLARDPGGVWIPVPPSAPGSMRALRLLRLDGSTAGEFGAPPGAPQSWARWDGRAPDGAVCPAGVYLLEARIVDRDGRVRTTRRPVVVGR